MIKAIILDFDATLVDYYANEGAALHRVVGMLPIHVDEGAFLDRSVEILLAAYEDGTEYGSGIHRHRIMGAVQSFGCAWREAYLEAYLDSYLTEVPAFPGASSFLGTTRERARLGLLSNAVDVREQRARIAASGLEPYFEAIGIAAEIGFFKPAKEAFVWIAGKLGAEPEECVYIGDSERIDILGAKAAGMRAVKKVGARSGPTAADAVFVDYQELLDNYGSLVGPA